MSATKNQPTVEAYQELQEAYSWFNERLFEDTLPECLLTMQRAKRTMGYFSKQRFVNNEGGKTDEIALNPEYFAVTPVMEVLSTLVHEQTHLWQEHFGTPARGRYHNKEWADKMESIGLCPSDTGRPGGRKVGDHMSDYVVAGGCFEKVAQELLETKWRISWYDRFPAREAATALAASVESVNQTQGNESHSLLALTMTFSAQASPGDLEVKPKASNREKYRCSGCGAQAWGKPKLNLVCGDCQQQMHAASE